MFDIKKYNSIQEIKFNFEIKQYDNNSFKSSYKDYMFKDKVNTNDLIEFFKRAILNINLNSVGSLDSFFFETTEDTIIKVDFFPFSKTYKYRIITKDVFGRELYTSYYLTKKSELLIEAKVCDGKLHSTNSPARITYKNKVKISEEYYFHGKFCNIKKINRILNKFHDKVKIKNLYKYPYDFLLKFNEISMDLNDHKMHEAILKEIEKRNVIKKLINF